MTGSDARHDENTAAAEGDMHASDWDERYGSHDKQKWSGEPNGVLVAEISGEAPGRALEVGCGEGADAIWLALQGWRVTAVDVSQVALDRAAIAADKAGAAVSWKCADVLTTSLGEHDLVSVQYPALAHSPNEDAIRALLAAVAPGGTLLVVGHAPGTNENAPSHGFDFARYIEPDDVAATLDDGWSIVVDETRPRMAAPTHGGLHSHDTVLRARRHPQHSTTE